VNNDGYDDILIGANYASSYAGKTYLIFGNKTDQISMDISLSDANASFIGESGQDYSGISVAGAGDVNNDGYDDILIGAYGNDDGGTNAGKTHLIFGNKTDQISMDISLSDADASFIGEASSDYSGRSVAGAGDVNGDGYEDILIGAYGNDDGGTTAGKTYLIFGNEINQISMDISLSDTDASFIGEASSDYSGWSVAGAGDVNNDGHDDILIGAYNASSEAGKTYLMFGWATPPGAFVLETNTTLPDTDGAFWLEWNNAIWVMNYSLHWSTSPGVDDGDTLYIEGLVNNSLRITGLSSGTYYFRLVAYNTAGSTWSNEIMVTVSIASNTTGGGIGGYDTILFIMSISISIGIISWLKFKKKR
jgi:hypothetical protein